MEEKFLLVKEKLQKYGQEQLLARYDYLSKEDRNKFLDEVLQLNFEQIKKLYEKVGESNVECNKEITTIDYIEKDKLPKDEKEKYEKIGENIIKKGEYAVITVAGGQRNKTWT